MRRWSLALLGALLLTLPACQQKTRKVVAVIPKGTSHLFWLSVQAGALAAGKEYDLEVVWNGPPSETDYPRQIQIMDSMVARHVDGIALAAAERRALVQAVDRAQQAKIPVVVFDSGLDSKNYLTFIATNNYQAGALGARALAKMLNGKGQVGMVMHVPGSASTMERESGFEDTLKKEFPGMKIVATQYGMSDRAKSRAAAENILTAHPDLDGMFASTEPSSVGISQALKTRELSGKVKFVAFDASDAMVDDLRSGTISAMVVQDPYRIGFEAVRVLSDRFRGKNPPERIDLDARLIAKEDLDKPDVQKLLGIAH